jgi:hypothetical protein
MYHYIASKIRDHIKIPNHRKITQPEILANKKATLTYIESDFTNEENIKPDHEYTRANIVNNMYTVKDIDHANHLDFFILLIAHAIDTKTKNLNAYTSNRD